MDKLVKRIWVNSLKGGGYRQNAGTYLRTPEGYDALGVLCDLYGREKGICWAADNITKPYTFLGQESVLPDEVVEWAELPNTPWDKHTVLVNKNKTTIARLCDAGIPFEAIAEIIEDQLWILSQTYQQRRRKESQSRGPR